MTSPHLVLGDLAHALDVARHICPRLTWVVVPDAELPNGRYVVSHDRQTMYFARSLGPDAFFVAWIDALRDLVGVCESESSVVPLRFGHRPRRGRTGTG